MRLYDVRVDGGVWDDETYRILARDCSQAETKAMKLMRVRHFEMQQDAGKRLAGLSKYRVTKIEETEPIDA